MLSCARTCRALIRPAFAASCFRRVLSSSAGKGMVDAAARCALVVVDVQNDFVSGSLALKDCAAKQDGHAVVSVINQLRKTCKWDLLALTMDWHPQNHCSFVDNIGAQRVSKDSPVDKKDAKVFDKVVFDDGTEQVLWPAHCVQNSWGAELVRDLDRCDTDVVVRKGASPALDSYSAFFDNAHKSRTGLEEQLAQAGITDVFVCGLAFDVCVKFTALDAVGLGFNTYVIEDACRGVDKQSIEATYREFRAKKIEIIHSANVPRLLSRLRSA